MIEFASRESFTQAQTIWELRSPLRAARPRCGCGRSNLFVPGARHPRPFDSVRLRRRGFDTARQARIAQGQEFLHVLSEQVRLDIEQVSHGPFPKRGDFVGVRYNPDAK